MWMLKWCQSKQIHINMEDYSRKCEEYFQELLYSNEQRHNELQSFNVDYPRLQQIIQQLNYPYGSEIISSLQSGDHERILQAYQGIYNWKKNLSFNQQDLVWELTKIMRNFMDKNDPYKFEKADAIELTQKAISGTQKNMENIKNILEQAISRIQNWSIPMVIVTPNPSYSLYNTSKPDYGEPATSANIMLGQSEYAPDFSYFYDSETNQIEIDDVLEAGDDEFFKDPKTQRDYFALIREIKNPGSSQKSGNRKVLYTARPVKDRHIYLDGNKIPTNIFLTNSLSEAESIGQDIAGPDKERDVWKVIIEEKYLILTLDTPTTKHYQAVGDSWIPCKVILISAV